MPTKGSKNRNSRPDGQLSESSCVHRVENLSVVNIDSGDESVAQFQANLRSFETSVEAVTRSKLKADKLNNFFNSGVTLMKMSASLTLVPTIRPRMS